MLPTTKIGIIIDKDNKSDTNVLYKFSIFAADYKK